MANAPNSTVVDQPKKNWPQGYDDLTAISTVQPQGQPSLVYNLPSALTFLAALDRIDIHQEPHAVEVFLGWEKNNRYQICDTNNQQFLLAKEDADCLSRQCLGNLRPFLIDIKDMQNQVVLQCDRPLRCQGCCCPCCLQEMDIIVAPGNKIASVKEIWSWVTPKYEVYDVQGQLIYKIQGPCCYCKCCDDVNFKIFTPDGSEVGEIIKRWNGCMEVCAQVNEFSIIFPRDMNVLNKSILLGTTFLIDFMYYEYKG